MHKIMPNSDRADGVSSCCVLDANDSVGHTSI